MTDEVEALPRSAGPGRRVGRASRIWAASALVLVAVLELLVATSRTTRRYATPSPRPGSSTGQHAVVWGPGVVAAVVSSVAVLVAIGWLIANWVMTRPPRRYWWFDGGIVLIAGVWVGATALVDTPSF